MNKKVITLLLVVGGLFLGSLASATDYCSMSVLGPSTSDYIARVILTGDSSTLDNTTTGSFNGPDYYELFSGGGVIVPTLTEGQNYTISIQIGTRNLSSVAAWIDFNGDGTFSTSERLGQTAAVVSNGFATYSFTAPSSLSGMSRLRVLDLWMSASLAYFGGSIPGCGAITITQGEIEDYNVNLIGTYAPPPSGGGQRRIIPVDFCPEGDVSMTPYDGLCVGMSAIDGVAATGMVDPNSTIIVSDPTPETSTGESTIATGAETTGEIQDIPAEMTTGGVDADADRCDDADMQTAFIYGSAHGLIDFQTCLLARMSDGLTRIDAAKILSIFAMNILDKKPNYNVTCPFSDMVTRDSDSQKYAIITCQLGLMGLKGDGTAAATFNPNELIDKAQFATILSRLIYGNKYNTSDACRYCKHVDALKNSGVLKVTTDLFTPLKRGYAMLMLMRIKN